ncbi:YbaN family protein [Tissierella sp. MB52-C2]|uniref:YbaN family protein n=1 Tax=Tissierella sp. MB52-C2 TaxID=3070999 RepID=UPI00280C25EF|nr:YbaN family protein [Tissierella sp. MB52-C2]WMM23614.1 YbaN family protein [Tissierella sp. MB52-C2]
MKIYKLLFIILGIIAMGIGIVGIVVPVLPTTPFLILASMFFVRGSEKFDIWFRNTKIYRDYAEDYINDKSMTLKRKIRLMFISDFMLAFPLIIIDNIYLKLFIVLVIIFKYYYFIFKIKTKEV